jgi:hypothetical protein
MHAPTLPTLPTVSVASTLRLGALALAGLAFVACDVDDHEPGDEPAGVAAQELDEATLEIVENLRIAGHPEEEIDVRVDGSVWVGGDAVVSLGASREMIGLSSREARGSRGEEAFRQYRTNNTVAPTIGLICIDGSRFTGTLSIALNAAIANYNNLDLSFNMVRTNGYDPGCDAEIVAYTTTGNGGSAGFPAGGVPYGQFFIGTDLQHWGTAVATHVITHELGHCVGFRHSDYYNRSISCGGSAANEGAAGVGAVHIPGTPVTAVWNGSVMNACFHGGSTGVWTATDVTALNTLYGADPASCEQSNACGGQAPAGCWCDPACVQYGDCCSDGPCTGINPSSCQQNATCGGQAPGGCWCDPSCTYYGDCCHDGPC